MSQSVKPVILIEFNELTPRLIEKFIAAGQLPNFKRFYDEAHIYTTDAEEEGENLNPWVQWITVHTGLPLRKHGILTLSEGHKLQYKSIWDLLSAAGLRTWVCGSMNARYDDAFNGYFLPDPWCTGVRPYPSEEFNTFYHFVCCAVQEHTNTGRSLSKRDFFNFLTFMLTHGLSFATMRSICTQLWNERITAQHHWKRVTLLDRLQWDLFRHYYYKYQPHFSTFFLNSTAHLQHAYWRNMEPDVFSIKPLAAEQEAYQDAILFGYQNMDDLLGRFMQLAGSDTTLIFCTGLSQQPFLKAETTGGRRYYRIKTPEVLQSQLKIADHFTYHPVMAEQFVMRFADPAAARRTQKYLQDYRVGDKSAFHTSIDGNDVMVQCSRSEALPIDTTLSRMDSDQTIPFFSVFYEMDYLKSGYHHPEGILWIRQPNRNHIIHEQKISLCSIMPMILDIYDISLNTDILMDEVTPLS